MAPIETPIEPRAQATAAIGGSGPQTVGEHLLAVTQRHSGVALQYARDGVPAYISYPELGTISSEIARGLISLGVQCGDRVAILGLTSAQWTLADCGSLCAGAVVAPIYHTNSPSECAYVLAHSGARIAICENAAQAAKIEQVRDRCPALEHVVLFEDDGSKLLTLDGLRQLGSEVPPDSVQQRLASMHKDDLATLVYTSGTTGPPKGCMLSHHNLLATARLYVEQLGFDDSHSLYQFLPLAHVLARVAQIVALSVGARIIYWSGNPAAIVEELGQTSPTHFPAVPRVYEKIHSAAIGRAHEGSRAQRVLFDWALRCGKRARTSLRLREQPDLLTDLQYRVADPLVLSKVRAAFGPALELGLIGAAPVARELLEFFDACGVLVLEGYGLSETCAAATLNTPDAHRFGTVGRPLPGTEVAIAADGEILIRGPQVFGGYYNDPDATEDALTPDGWLRSGDLGAIDAQGFVTINGRKKDLIITSSGKNITPVNIESELRDQPSITEAVVYGDNRPYLVAMLTLDREESVKLARRLGIDTDQATIARDPRVHAEISKQVAAVNDKFARIEQIKRFAILDHDLTQADGELTPTLKVKRAAVYERYADLFGALYEQGGES
ncbi:MAG: AMP-dependent synthetase/ligase [Solirubrobacteraceae bacterium]